MEALHSMQSTEISEPACNKKLAQVFRVLSRRLRRFCSKIRRWFGRRRKAKVVIRRFGKLNCKGHFREVSGRNSPNHINGDVKVALGKRSIRVATFNAALFSLAPAVPKAEKSLVFFHGNDNYKPVNSRPKSILKQSPLHPAVEDPELSSNQSKLIRRVSINLPENEISLAQNKLLSFVEDSSSPNLLTFNSNSMAPMRSPICFPLGMANWMNDGSLTTGRQTIFDVLKEVDADILALQDVKAEEEKNMTPLSDLAEALGMNYVFAESWAPEYGNAILSKWPIKKWKVQKIYDDKDFRNVLKATILVPWMGELNFYCTQLDHLDENWRMKQINAIIQSSDHPHILAGGLNSLDASDYSFDRWANIVKYYESLGKPTPKVEVTNFLKEKEYTDAKYFPGDFEPVVIIAKGQSTINEDEHSMT
ncbi:OLC1v1020257C2 [Oldenlandia corymbosa var. corymbosa]|uniref:OLC1v1020257C2 n=1 Tax=Oldenlandia corymbosa var. corymbosa TaxID=529605 RepID=A0AAV1EGB0_OLDCO|nr:OLC1v1020257C2 [Oldenlandia corymbosa var. corymbosa]